MPVLFRLDVPTTGFAVSSSFHCSALNRLYGSSALNRLSCLAVSDSEIRSQKQKRTGIYLPYVTVSEAKWHLFTVPVRTVTVSEAKWLL
jgi:hypothetical protein